MKRWSRVNRPMHCGRCGDLQSPGAPVLEYVIGVHTFIRCATCEGGAPPDLPLVIEHTTAPLPTLDFSRLGLLPIDYKARAAEREPGEEG